MFSVNCVGRESSCSLRCRDVCTSGGVSQVFAAGMFPVVREDDHSGSVLCCSVCLVQCLFLFAASSCSALCQLEVCIVLKQREVCSVL